MERDRITPAIRLCPLCKGKKMWCITCRGDDRYLLREDQES